MFTEISSTRHLDRLNVGHMDHLARLLFKAATEGWEGGTGRPIPAMASGYPGIDDIVSCDVGRLKKFANHHGLMYHVGACPEHGRAVMEMVDGQVIVLNWAPSAELVHSFPLILKVRVKNPVAQTLLHLRSLSHEIDYLYFHTDKSGEFIRGISLL